MTSSPNGAPSEALVIVGSRLQALIFACIGIAIVAGVGLDQWWWTVPVAVVLGVIAVAIFVRRVELGEHEVIYRRFGFGTATAARSDVAATCGHRYLELEVGHARPGRIEVPVEIRPQVRSWAEATSPDRH